MERHTLNKYDFIEIGTSDFQTLIEKSTDETKGISIDPMQFYLDRLPDRKNCIKICIAISNYDGEADLHYIPQEIIDKHNLPYWVRGCARIGSRHPFLKILISNQSMDHPIEKPIDPDEAFSIKKVKVTRLKNIIDQYQIDAIKIMKIDVEGMDEIILSDYFKCCEEEGCPLPNTIQFEHVLLQRQKYRELIKTAKRLGYNVVAERDDTLLIKKHKAKLACPTCKGTGVIHE